MAQGEIKTILELERPIIENEPLDCDSSGESDDATDDPSTTRESEDSVGCAKGNNITVDALRQVSSTVASVVTANRGFRTTDITPDW